MSKNQDKNLKPRKYTRFFVTALMVVILVSVAVVYFKTKNQIRQQAQTEVASNNLPSWWYEKYFGKSMCEDVTCNPDADPDSDKLTNSQEYFYHTDPLNFRTVGDDLSDGELVAAGFDPSRRNRITFEQAASDDNILSESLLLDVDIKKIVAEDLDIDRVAINLVDDTELKITKEESKDVYEKYSEEMHSLIEKYFPSQTLDNTVKTLESGNGASLDEVRRKASLLSSELKTILVPQEVLMFHKYNIALYQLVSDVTNPDAQGSDAWFDKVQELLAAQQRLNFEKQRLLLLDI